MSWNAYKAFEKKSQSGGASISVSDRRSKLNELSSVVFETFLMLLDVHVFTSGSPVHTTASSTKVGGGGATMADQGYFLVSTVRSKNLYAFVVLIALQWILGGTIQLNCRGISYGAANENDWTIVRSGLFNRFLIQLADWLDRAMVFLQ